jgi:hypothetical protein
VYVSIKQDRMFISSRGLFLIFDLLHGGRGASRRGVLGSQQLRVTVAGARLASPVKRRTGLKWSSRLERRQT